MAFFSDGIIRADCRRLKSYKSPDPIILVVKAHDAWKAGVAFYAGNEKVWLADRVPPEFIDFGQAFAGWPEKRDRSEFDGEPLRCR